jgi:hypothetical protein
MFTLNGNDWLRGLIVAVIAPLVVSLTTVLGTIIQTPGFDVFSVDWMTLGHSLVNISIISAWAGFSGYIGKGLLTTDSGKALGIVGQ